MSSSSDLFVFIDSGQIFDVCESIITSSSGFIAVDTEFFRIRSQYYPKISLVQISCPSGCFVFDMLSNEISDFNPLIDVFLSKEIVKVFHDCKQDVSAIYHALGVYPNPIADTQIAMMFCRNYESKVGYSVLVNEMLGVHLEKSYKRADWSKRPMPIKQLRYAAFDVLYLHKIYEKINHLLRECGRLEWFKEEMNYYSSPSYPICSVSNNLLENLRIIRDHVARRDNTNKSIVLSDVSIIKICQRMPKTFDEFSALVEHKLSYDDIMRIIDTVSLSSKSVSLDCDMSVIWLLNTMVESRCRQFDISKLLVASRSEIIMMVQGMKTRLSYGWRYVFIGKEVISCIESEECLLSFIMKKGSISSSKVVL